MIDVMPKACRSEFIADFRMFMLNEHPALVELLVPNCLPLVRQTVGKLWNQYASEENTIGEARDFIAKHIKDITDYCPGSGFQNSACSMTDEAQTRFERLCESIENGD